MLSFFGLLFYVVLELLRPDILFPGVTAPIMLWVALGSAAVCILENVVSGRGFQFFPSTRFLLGLLIVGTLSAVLGGENLDGILATGSDLTKLFLIYMVLTHSAYTERRLRLFRSSLTVLIIILCAEGIAFSLGYRFPGFGWDKQHRLQYTGIFADSNDLGQLYATGWAFLLFAAVNQRGFGRRGMMLIGAAATGWAIYLTQSRGAILGAAVGLILALRKRIGIVLPGIVALIGLIVMNQFGIARMDKLSTQESSAEGRIKSWAQGWYMLRSNPLFGVGPLNYTHYHPIAAHSSPVEVAAETGVLGLFCWIGFFYFPLRETIESMWHRRSMSTDPPFVVQQIQAALLVLIVTGLFLSRAYTLLPYLLAGLVLCGRRLAETEGEPQTDGVQKSWRQVSWMDLRHVAALQMVCMLGWRFLARHYIAGI